MAAPIDPVGLFNTLVGKGVPTNDAATATLIAQRESSLVPDAQNPNGAKGLFAFLPSTWSGYRCSGDPLNANDSINCFVRAYKTAGFSDWGGKDVLNPTYNGKPISTFPGNEGVTSGGIAQGLKPLCATPLFGDLPGVHEICTRVENTSPSNSPTLNAGGDAASAIGSHVYALLPSWLKGIPGDLVQRTVAVVLGGALLLLAAVIIFHIPPPIPIPV